MYAICDTLPSLTKITEEKFKEEWPTILVGPQHSPYEEKVDYFIMHSPQTENSDFL